MPLWFLIFACGSDPASVGVSPPPPPLVVSSLVAGGPVDVSVDTGLGAGVRVGLVGGAGAPAAGPCPPALGGLCLAIRRPRVIGTALTDPAGRASFRVVLPNAPGLTVTLQVARPDPAAAWVSSPASGALLDGQADADGDGLTNLAELRARSDVHVPDTDGGGTLDGQEVLVDRTDPTAGADDVGVERRCAGDGVDDDSDGLADCADADCARVCPEVRCDDGVDDDLDGRADCVDLDCPACAEDCGNGVDDDRDGVVDGRDPDCGDACDGLDRDGDRLVDCADPDCACAEACGNGADDDGDLLADCLDPDCGCVEQCTNLVDDDRDGLADCADPDCGLACGESCDNGVDDDQDGLVDCEDGGCVDLCAEDCTNGVDDNGDAWADCQDDDCWGAPSCPPPSRVAWVEGGELRVRRLRVQERGSPCFANGDVASTAVTASDVVGRVRVDHAGRTDTCAWRVDRATFRDQAGWGLSTVTSTFLTTYGFTWTFEQCVRQSFEQHDADRAGFRVEPGCGVDGSDVLPARLVGGVQPFVARTSAGAPWYGGLLSGTSSVNHSGGGGGPLDVYSVVAGYAEPLQPVGAHGVCAAGEPALVPDVGALWGVGGACVP